MLKKFRLFILTFVCVGILNNAAVHATSSDTSTNLWGSSVSDAFQNLVAKELLSFGKSDPVVTTKDELLDRAKALKESLGGFADTIKSATDKPSDDKKKDHQDKKTDVPVAPAPENKPDIVTPAVPVLPAVTPPPVVSVPVVALPVLPPVPSAVPAPVLPAIPPPASVVVPSVPAPAALPALPPVPSAPSVPVPPVSVAPTAPLAV